ncbi:MAG: protein-disulfide reductase DsbD domain-containing protein [Verrucomicrobiota bacterium]
MRFLGLLVALLLPWRLQASDAENPLTVRLISETKNIQAGQPFFLGLHLVHPSGSHSYWKHPGIVGIATRVEWDLPPGFRAGEIQWPAPQVVKMASYDAQGYEGETLLMVPITSPENLTAASVTLNAKASWMCCGKTCNPAVKIPFSITLAVADSAKIDPGTQPLFEKFRALVPRPDPAWKSSVKREEGHILLTLQPPAAISNPIGIRFFTADGQVDSNQKQLVEILPNGVIRMTLAISETAPDGSKTLPGVVSLPSGALPFPLEIDPAF